MKRFSSRLLFWCILILCTFSVNSSYAPNPKTNYQVVLQGKHLLPETKAWLSQLTVKPSAAYIKAVNTLIKTLIADGNWVLLDRIWVFATEQQQHARISLVNPSSTAIMEINSPSWTALQGYIGDASTKALNTNYIASVDGVNYTLNSSSHGFYCRTNNNTAGVDMGVQDGSGNSSYIIAKFSDNNFYGKINNASSNFCSVANSDARGLYAVVRTASNSIAGYKNGSSIVTDTDASTARPSVAFFLLGNNLNGGLNFPSNRQIAMSFIGSGSINQLKLYNAFQTFATTIGFNI